MKQLSLLLLLPFFFSCSSDDKEADNIEPTQDYTSFVFVHNEPVNFINSVVGYYTKEGLCKKVAELGDLTQAKQSKEIKIENDNITELYFFTDYISPRRLDAVYKLKKNSKNIFEIDRNTSGITVDKDNKQEYPH